MEKKPKKVISINEKIKWYRHLFVKISVSSVSLFILSSIGLLINGHFQKKNVNKILGITKSKEKPPK